MTVTSYTNGYRAYNSLRPYDPSQSQEWKNGWKQAEADSAAPPTDPRPTPSKAGDHHINTSHSPKPKESHCVH